MKLSFRINFVTEVVFRDCFLDFSKELFVDTCFVVDSSLKNKIPALPDQRVFYFSGESEKDLNRVEECLEWLVEFKAGRKTKLVAIGGGATTDFGAFVASIYNRGMELILVPTTLLAAIDSAIGGKTAVNFVAKNMVGSIYPASKVFIIREFLSSLSSKMIESGKTEMIKVALLKGGKLSEFVRNGKDLLCEKCLSLAIDDKYKIISSDVADTLGKRIVLNWGHTFGHAIERYNGVPHGIAVASGMVLMQKYSKFLGFESYSAIDLEEIFQKHGVKHDLSLYVDDNKWVKFIAFDKKRNLEDISMVYLKKIGSAGIISRNLNDILKDLEDLR